MTKKLFLLTSVLLASLGAQAQNVPITEPLSTDRPDFTESTSTVAVGKTQIESGYTLTRSGDEKTHSFGEVLLRQGLSKRAELRLGLNSYELERVGGEHDRGRDDTQLGIKYILSDGAEHFEFAHPALALIVATELPTGSRSQRMNGLQPFAKLCLNWPVSDSLDVSANINAARINDGGDHLTQLASSVSLGKTFSSRVGAFAEVYALEREERDGNGSQFFDTGLSYLLNPNFQIDARIGLGFNPSVSGRDYFTGAGFGWRF